MRPLTRKDFLGKSAQILAGGALTPAFLDRPTQASESSIQNPKPKTQNPNILMILADDLGWGDLSCYGAPDLKTPNLDRLAAEGVRFENFYANCPVCSPTRAALLTGRYPEMVGVPGVIRTHPNNSWGRLAPDARLLPAVLKPAGYTSAIVGKWHLGLESPSLPNERGFDFFHGFLGDMMDDYYTHLRHGNNYMRLNGEVIDPKGHATDLFTEWACEFLRAQKRGKPFFLYLAYNAPHDPIQPPQEWLDHVRRRSPQMDERRAKLVALIEHMDDGIGKVLAALKEAGLEQDTLVVFSSDNGGLIRLGANNGPWRDGKGTLYEGGLRVPMIARWPGRIAAGTRSERVALTMDLFPTFVEAAGATLAHEIDGQSFLPALLGQSKPEPGRDLFFGRREGGKGFDGGTIECIRRGDWKLLRSQPGAPFELYNLKDDPCEKTDLAQTHPEKVKELSAALEVQLKRYAAVPWK
ncbi:MAG: sulfatase [Candidatus Sumerlaeia bacterium]|nr:sulfatase [Candidatus Sumerlaeia bacterium]